jgi:uncharacterized protein DUF4333
VLRPLATLLAAASLLLAGCGSTEIDSSKAEKFVKGAFATPPKSVKCPDGVEAKTGGTLTCQVVDATGKRYDLTLHMVDGEGRVKFGRSDLKPVG